MHDIFYYSFYLRAGEILQQKVLLHIGTFEYQSEMLQKEFYIFFIFSFVIEIASYFSPLKFLAKDIFENIE